MTPDTLTEKRRCVPQPLQAGGESRPASVRRRWLRRLIPAAIIVAAVAVVWIVARLPSQKPPTVAVEIPPVNVSVLRVEAVPELADTVALSAVVEPDCVVRVAAEVAGRIERWGERRSEVEWLGRVFAAGTAVLEGEPVSAGDVILYLNTDLLKARHDRAAAQFEYDEREYRRIVDLFENGATAKNELADARTKRDVSKAVLDEATRALERAVILAPMSGMLNKQASMRARAIAWRKLSSSTSSRSWWTCPSAMRRISRSATRPRSSLVRRMQAKCPARSRISASWRMRAAARRASRSPSITAASCCAAARSCARG